MTDSNVDLAALIGSRICHDLISPIGAITNGLELLEMSQGTTTGPEMALIADSCANANARIRFFRVAFGAAGRGQSMSRGEVIKVLDALSKGGRLSYDYGPTGDMDRAEIQLAFLGLLCAETALPRGGKVTVDYSARRWRIVTDGSPLRIEPEVWVALDDPAARKALAPAQVQFALLPVLALTLGRSVSFEQENELLRLTV
ncbi:histidine phosphotransferase family protein [Mesobacterium pallidum]|uniref:histidine phosphotransferase family protein n=1 Tax=Mesobacterium pallidum TaxID=2872037 RepID=UPI001EE3841A|nr:histidine phosphotransferase family protein [Mesobacterium pallidum]